MNVKRMIVGMVVVVMMGSSGIERVLAQATPQQAAPPARPAEPTPPPVPLKVTVTISRFEGTKKTANLPFVLWVNADDGRNGSSIRLSNEMPIPSTATKEGVTSTSYSYRQIGTNIDCSATAVAPGLYRLGISVEDSQIFRLTPTAPELPRASVQSFRVQHNPILRDGQTVEFAVATDKTTGEVIHLEVMLSVVK
jgi:hypothetical protein